MGGVLEIGGTIKYLKPLNTHSFLAWMKNGGNTKIITMESMNWRVHHVPLVLFKDEYQLFKFKRIGGCNKDTTRNTICFF